ncbi:zinc finger protein 862-like [Saccoglossus kowalevskii]
MHRNFVRPCDTRWLSVRGAVEAVLINLKAMFYCLQSDAESGDSTARGMLNEMATFDFLAILHLMADVLYYLGQLSCVFQKTYLDLSSVDGHIKAVVNVLKNMKDDPGRRLKSFLSSVPETPSELYMKVAAANLTGDIEFVTSKSSSDEAMITIKDNSNLRKWFVSCKSEFLDKLVDNLETRFPESNFLKAFHIFIPSHLPKATSPEYKQYGFDEIETLCSFYGTPKTTNDGMQHAPVIDSDKLKDEWPVVKEILRNNYMQCNFQDTWGSLLGPQACLPTLYPNIAKLVTISLIIPVNTADCERGFSRYNLIKTKGRARLKVSSVSALMSIALGTPPLKEMLSFNFRRAFQIWCSMKQRRIIDTSKSIQPASTVKNINDCMLKLIDSVKQLTKLDREIDCFGDSDDCIDE